MPRIRKTTCLLAPSALEALGLCFLFSSTKRFEQVFFLDLLVRSASFLGHHFLVSDESAKHDRGTRRYLARHFTEFIWGQLATDDAFAQARVRLVLEIDERGTDLAFVYLSGATKQCKDGLFDRKGTAGDEIDGWSESGEKRAWEDGTDERPSHRQDRRR